MIARFFLFRLCLKESFAFESSRLFSSYPLSRFQLRRKKSAIESTSNRGYFRSVDPIRGSHCSRDPSLAVILGVSRSNKSRVELASDYRSSPIVIHPCRFGLDKPTVLFDNFASVSRDSYMRGRRE